MNSKSNLQIDILIKRIYSSYIDIKSGDFKEIDKDILLTDISQLYMSIKELYPNHHDQINELEQEILLEKSQKQKTAETVAAPIISSIVAETKTEAKEENSNATTEEIKSITEQSKIDEPKIKSTTVNEFDLTMFMDNDKFHTLTTHPFAEKKAEIQTNITENLSNIELNQQSNIDQFKNIEILSEPSTKLNSNPIIDSEPVKEVPQIESISELEYKSAGKIMDFLHDGEQTSQKDIYSYLDINTRIGLVELFFKGNSLELTEALVKINKLNSKDDCIAVINKYAAQFEVKETEDIYQTFLHLINRKFSGL